MLYSSFENSSTFSVKYRSRRSFSRRTLVRSGKRRKSASYVRERRQEPGSYLSCPGTVSQEGEAGSRSSTAPLVHVNRSIMKRVNARMTSTAQTGLGAFLRIHAQTNDYKIGCEREDVNEQYSVYQFFPVHNLCQLFFFHLVVAGVSADLRSEFFLCSDVIDFRFA